MLATITPKSALYPTLVEAAMSWDAAQRAAARLLPGPWSHPYFAGQAMQDQAAHVVDFAGRDWHIVPVTEQTAKKLGYSTRGANATVCATRGESCQDRKDGRTEWKGGRPIRYHRAENDIAIRSIARIMPSPTGSPPRRLVYVRHNSVYVLRLPKGWAWGTDGIGLRAYLVERPDCDYHPDSDDLATDIGWAVAVVAKAIANEQRRLERARKAEHYAARLADCWVCLRDSISGGNCATGSHMFAVAARLSPDRHYRAEDVLRLSTAENHNRVNAAVLAAMAREDREAAAGCCVLADHRIGK